MDKEDLDATLLSDKRNTDAGAASTSMPSFSTEGDGKELTGGGKRGKKGGNKSEAAGDASGGRVS